MNVSYEGIGQWAATFACGAVSEGEPVKLSANGTVAACGAGDVFCGTVLSVSHGGDACSAQLGGMTTMGYTGTAPAPGYAALVADGAAGVKIGATGRSYLVVDVDTAAKTVTFAL